MRPMNPFQMFGNMQNMQAKLNQFQQQLQSQNINPQQKVMELLQTGKMSQPQFEQLKAMASQLSGMFGGMK